MPRVVGLKVAQATAKIVGRRCRIGRLTTKLSPLKMKGRVLAQKGKVLRNAARVDLVVGKGPRRR